MKIVTPVIMCGGSGTRLWPLSRAESPKQFQRLDSGIDISFFQATVQRHQSGLFRPPMALVNAQHLNLVRRQLSAIQASANIVVEPVGRNTAPAIAVAALLAQREDSDQVLLTVPSDHQMSSVFNSVVAKALEAVEEGYIVTFGIKPTYAETGYGYITDGGSLNGFKHVHRVSKFTEKPPIEIASSLIAEGDSYWASGIALFKPSALLQEYERHAPDILEMAEKALLLGSLGDGCLTLHAETYASARNVSVETAVLEKSQQIVLAPADVEWDDLGAWPAFHRMGEKSAEGNVTAGDVMLFDTRNSYVRSEAKLVTIVGLSDVVVVDTKDALLIADMKHAQSVKNVVSLLSNSSRPEALRHALTVEAWGTRQSVSSGAHYKLEEIVVNSGCTAEIGGQAGAVITTGVEGQGHLDTGEDTHEVNAGSTLEFEPSTPLRITNTGLGDLTVIMMLLDPKISDTSLDKVQFQAGSGQVSPSF